MLDPKEDMYSQYCFEILERTDLKTETTLKIKFSEVHYFQNLPKLNSTHLLTEMTKDLSLYSFKFIHLLYHIYNITLLEEGKTEFQSYGDNHLTFFLIEKYKLFAIYEFTISEELSLLIPNWQQNFSWKTENSIFEEDE